MLEDIIQSGDHPRIILYGGGRVGKNVFRALRQSQISPDFFLDENRNITELYGIPVVSPERYEVQPGDIVILCMTYHHICDELEVLLREKGVPHILRHTQILSSDLLTQNGCPYPSGEVDARTCRRCIVEGLACHEPVAPVSLLGSGTDPLYFDQLTLFVTTACTLNCAECVTRVPEYKLRNKQVTLDLEAFQACWANFRQAITYVKVLLLCGGEVLLYRRLAPLLQEVLEDPKIGVVHILTNGTIEPPEEVYRLLCHDKMVVTVDDYGDHISGRMRANMLQFESKLKDIGANTLKIDNTNGTWYSLKHIENRGRTARENAEVFKKCCFSYCKSISPDLRFELCGMPSRLRHLGYEIPAPEDSIDLRDKTADQMHSQLLDYLKRDALSCCGFCEGCHHDNIVQAGRQA